MIATVALTSVVLLPSVSRMPGSTATGVEVVLSPLTNCAEPLSVLTVGPAVTTML